MSLIDELLAEKRRKVFGTITEHKKLKKIDNVTVVIDNPSNSEVARIVKKTGHMPSKTSFTFYCINERNKKIGAILNKFGNPEI